MNMIWVGKKQTEQTNSDLNRFTYAAPNKGLNLFPLVKEYFIFVLVSLSPIEALKPVNSN